MGSVVAISNVRVGHALLWSVTWLACGLPWRGASAFRGGITVPWGSIARQDRSVYWPLPLPSIRLRRLDMLASIPTIAPTTGAPTTVVSASVDLPA